MQKESMRVILRSYLIGLFIFVVACPGTSIANIDYKFFDEYGNEIKFPKNATIHSKDKNPKGWCGLKSPPEPIITRRVRKSGLESVQILTAMYPNILNRDGETKVEEIFIADKDELIIGHQEIEPSNTEAFAEVWINGIINYVKVYAKCSEGGLWETEVKLY